MSKREVWVDEHADGTPYCARVDPCFAGPGCARYVPESEVEELRRELASSRRENMNLLKIQEELNPGPRYLFDDLFEEINRQRTEFRETKTRLIAELEEEKRQHAIDWDQCEDARRDALWAMSEVERLLQALKENDALFERLDKALASAKRVAQDTEAVGGFVSGLNITKTADDIVEEAEAHLNEVRHRAQDWEAKYLRVANAIASSSLGPSDLVAKVREMRAEAQMAQEIIIALQQDVNDGQERANERGARILELETQFKKARLEALEEAAAVAGKYESHWFDCDVPEWLSSRLGCITSEIRALATQDTKEPSE